jgi:GMP synthase-like glutamine amidotransferase
MKVTVIETGRPPDIIAAQFPCYPVMARTLLTPHFDRFEVETISLVDGDRLPDQNDIEAVLILGSPVGVYDPVSWIEPLKDWIRANAAARIPQVGICFGHQIIAAAFGAHVQKAPQGWGLGRHDYDIHINLPWHPAQSEKLSLAVSHQDQVLTLPPQARVLASSPFTPHAALLYDHAPTLSFQGHPEFCPTFIDALIRSRRGTRFSEELADAALESLNAPLDGPIVGSWIAGFYRHYATSQQSRTQAAVA